MTPGQARAARAFLNLDMKTVCLQALIGKRTLTEFERGSRSINDTTMARLEGFYISKGIDFKLKGNDETSAAVAYYFKNFEHTNSGEIRPKIEYEDRFNLIQIESFLHKLDAEINYISDAVIFSSRIIEWAMIRSGLNQKQLSISLNCSPAFISAIILRKKPMSVELARKIEILYGMDNLSNYVQSEKKIKMNLKDIQKAVNGIADYIERVKLISSTI